jgi:hypothetical protein
MPFTLVEKASAMVEEDSSESQHTQPVKVIKPDFFLNATGWLSSFGIHHHSLLKAEKRQKTAR